MSALGFGLFIGSIATASLVTSRAFERLEGINLALIAAGILFWIVTPPLILGFPGFMIGAALPPIIAFLLFKGKIDALAEVRAADDARRAAERQAAQRRREIAKENLERWPSEQPGWNYISKARIMHVAGQPKCYFMMSQDGKLLRMATYQESPEFIIDSDSKFHISKIISFNMASPTVTKYRTKITPVTKIEQEQKSPVARGLIGGAILGPTGLVLGAASGLNSKITSTVTHEKTLEDYETLGDAQLIMGTSDPDNPVLKIKFDPPSLAEEWMFRIMGCQRNP